MSGRQPRSLTLAAQQFLRRHARQHDYVTAKLLPLVVAAVGPVRELSVRDFLWSLKYQATEAGENVDSDDGADTLALIADLRSDSDDAMAQFRGAFGPD
jgi:hypothetical protein